MSVYFIQAGEGGRIKIGFASIPERRISYLRRFSGPDLIVLAVIEGVRAVEYRIHQELAAHRAHDEWFEPTAEVLEVVRRARQLPQDDGRLTELSRVCFATDETKYLSRRPDVIGAAAKEAHANPGSYTWGTLLAIVRLFGPEVDRTVRAA
jgi:hypothetical protein